MAILRGACTQSPSLHLKITRASRLQDCAFAIRRRCRLRDVKGDGRYVYRLWPRQQAVQFFQQAKGISSFRLTHPGHHIGGSRLSSCPTE